jgi:DNA primase
MLLEIILQQPTWASRIPLELVPDHSPEAATLHVIANQLEHGELPAGGVGMLLEHFRDTPHEEVISRFAIHLAEDNDPAELEAVLNDAVERIRNTGLAEEIAVLTAQARNGGLDAADQQRLMELLRRKSSAKPLPST